MFSRLHLSFAHSLIFRLFFFGHLFPSVVVVVSFSCDDRGRSSFESPKEGLPFVSLCLNVPTFIHDLIRDHPSFYPSYTTSHDLPSHTIPSQSRNPYSITRIQEDTFAFLKGPGSRRTNQEIVATQIMKSFPHCDRDVPSIHHRAPRASSNLSHSPHFPTICSHLVCTLRLLIPILLLLLLAGVRVFGEIQIHIRLLGFRIRSRFAFG